MKSEADVRGSEADVSCSKADVSCSEAEVSCSEAEVSRSEADVSCSEAEVSCSEADVSCSKADVSCSKAQLPSSKAQLPSSEADVLCSEADVSCSEVDVPCSKAQHIFPILNSQFPIPNSQFPIPNSPFPIPHSQSVQIYISSHSAEIFNIVSYQSWNWDIREAIILSLTDENLRVSWGEIAPISWFGSETLEQALDFCNQLPKEITEETIFSIPDDLPACQFGFESAWEGLGIWGDGEVGRWGDEKNSPLTQFPIPHSPFPIP